MHLYLRIAASLFFALVTLALCVLWVRSYWRIEFIKGSVGTRHYCAFGYAAGEIGVDVLSQNWSGGFTLNADSVARISNEDTFPKKDGLFAMMGFMVNSSARSYVLAPFWFFVLIAAILAAAPWLQWIPHRFSLRTMLIASTLVAVVLGAVVWAAR